MRLCQTLLAGVAALCIAGSAPVYANLIIDANFGSTITSDTNAAAIENVINTAIATYEADFTNSATIYITFQEETTGLGNSVTEFTNVSYKEFYDHLVADANSPNDAVALAGIDAAGGDADTNGGVNPITGSTTINVKTANLKALGLGFLTDTSASDPDGTVSLNTSTTFPGSPGTSGTYSLLATTEHEIDEVLGLGSSLPNTNASSGTISIANNGAQTAANGPFPAGPHDPFPEDLFRYSYTSTVGVDGQLLSSVNCGAALGAANAYFALNGTSAPLAQFNNLCNNGDFGDWASNPNPIGTPVQVQDAFATVGATPTLGVELTALDVIGYTLAAPEPSSWILMFGGLLAMAVSYKTSRRITTKKI